MIWFFLFIFFNLPLYSDDKIALHLLLDDYESAFIAAEKRYKENPDQFAKILCKILCKKESIQEALVLYNKHFADSVDHELLEEISWAIFSHGKKSLSPQIRRYAYLSALSVQKTRSVSFFIDALSDSSDSCKNIALHFAQLYPDSRCKKALEKSTSEKLVQDDELDIELLKSNKSEERKKTLLLILEKQKKEHLDKVMPLLEDDNQDVRLLALSCFYFLAPENYPLTVKTEDFYTETLYRFYLFVKNDLKDSNYFEKALLANDPNQALFTAMLLAHNPEKSKELLLWGIDQPCDPYVRLNLATGLVYLQESLQECREKVQKILLDIVACKDERLSIQQKGPFSFISKTTTEHVPFYKALPETVDLLARLELVRMAFSYGTITSPEHLKPLLQARCWQVPIEAQLFALQEGVASVQELKHYLNDPSQEIRLQAAFLLATLYQDPDALQFFENFYPEATSDMKESILVAIGQIGSRESIPFLLKCLQEPFETTRIVAARSIIFCLNK